MLVGPVHERLKQPLEQVIEAHAWNVLKLAIQSDHVHLLLQANPYTLPADHARKLNGRSSHLLRAAFPQSQRMPSFWTRSTFSSTTSKVSGAVIERSMAQQAKR
jgi:putative transposase